MKGLFTAMIYLLALTACTTGWVRVDDASSTYSGEHYSVTLPVGWMKITDGDQVQLSRDGPDLQRIIILYRPHEQAFETLEKSSSATMLPSELAELSIAELKASSEEELPGLEVLSNAPVEIAGKTGYGLHLGFMTDQGLRIEVLMLGLVDENGYYELLFRAPSLHYFNRDRGSFESVSASFQTN